MANRLAVVEATAEHVRQVMLNLRDEDKAELAAVGWHFDQDEAVLGLVWACDLLLAAVDNDTGRAVAVGGVNSDPPAEGPCSGLIWMMGTPDLKRHWREFVRRSPKVLNAIQQGYGLLYNTHYADNPTHIRWLRRAGFRFISKGPGGVPGGPPSRVFVRTAPCPFP